MIFGSKNDDFDFKDVLQEGLKLVGVFNLADYIPYIAALDLQGLGRRMKAISKVLDGFLDKIIDEHEHEHDVKELKGQHMNFIDLMLSLMESDNTRELHIERDNIKAIVLDIFATAMDSSSIAIVWALSELLKHPRVMKLVQEELDNVVGLERMVEETDLVDLCYLKMVKSTVIINNWAIGRDPNAWSSNGEEFYPERFIGTDIDIQGHNFQYLPFGSGQRKCPGMQLGMTVVQLVLAQVIHCFKFNLELPDGMSPDDLDMTETFGITMPKTKHLMAIPTYRLCASTYN
ncbi:Cytochrome p450 [Thalictrum thalictroides]|uniref:Cytochrome p450 n=1 Tax=Thalictrum thalictroides TaxID=46969 RepID=A0A7J6VU75_THATH|nr:Cytochrome p450 [Thalictrum thalictroides]